MCTPDAVCIKYMYCVCDSECDPLKSLGRVLSPEAWKGTTKIHSNIQLQKDTSHFIISVMSTANVLQTLGFIMTDRGVSGP